MEQVVVEKETRWKKAQVYEQVWWGARINDIDFSYLKTFAFDLSKELEGILTITKQTEILEIGSGPAGILTYIDSDHKYAVDPLEHYYSTVDDFVKIRDERTQYYSVKGEEMPFQNGQFQLVLMDNVLDHGEEPEKILKEMYRVLKKDGIVFFQQNVYHIWGAFVRSLMESFEIDKGHPHTFTKSGLQQQLSSLGFEVLKYKHRGYFNTWLKEISSGNRKALLRALLFTTRDKVTYILKKK